MLTIGSLFSGIGGLELGLEMAGLGPTLWQVERDPFCRSVLAKHWPEAKRFDDVCSAGSTNLVPVDLICGGFPCQDISYAGKGAGLTGKRSGLWFEYARIIREMEPRVVVVENVAALLNIGMGDVLASLASLGYDCWWDCIPAAAVGAPHIRDRVFIVAHKASGQRLADAMRLRRLEAAGGETSSGASNDRKTASQTNGRRIPVHPDRAGMCAGGG